MIEDLISSGRVVIFSKTTCPYCHKVKDFFKNEANTEYVCYELDEVADGSKIKDELVKMTNQTSVPSIFINGIFNISLIFRKTCWWLQ